MLTCCCCGGAGWSGGSESDEIRRRRSGMGKQFVREEEGGLVSSQIRPGRSARRAGPHAGPFIGPPVGTGHRPQRFGPVAVRFHLVASGGRAEGQ